MEKRLLAELFQPVEKSLIVIAGANGSGKSTLVEGLELKFDFAHLDPDKVVVKGAQSAVGRKVFSLREKLLREDATFGLETTLSGKGSVGFLNSAKLQIIGSLWSTCGLIIRRYVSSESG